MKRWLNYDPIRARRIGMGLGAAVTVALAFLTWLAPNVIVRLDHAALDYQFRLRGERSPDQDIVLVLIDEKSLKEIGRWPWPRDIQAQLIDRITAGRPGVLGLDIIYAEPEESREMQAFKVWLDQERRNNELDRATFDTLTTRLESLDTDRRLASSLGRNGSVVVAMPFFVHQTGMEGPLTDLQPMASPFVPDRQFMIVKRALSVVDSHPYEAASALPPLSLFERRARGLGHVYRLPDHDGTTRREVLALRYGDSYYPSFALEVARLFLGIPREQMVLLIGEGVQLGPVVVPTDQKLRMLIDYAGPAQHFPWVSATDVIHNRIDSRLFESKVVLVGTAALGTYDQLSTPFSANVSGVEKNATVVENIVHRRLLSDGLWSGPVQLSLVLLFGFSLTYCLPRMRALPATCLAMGIGLAYAGTVQALFTMHGLCVPLVMPATTIGTVFSATTLLNVILKEQQTRQIQSMFASYVSPKIVEILIAHPSLATVGGQRKELTMLFTDLVGFTRISEQYSPEAVVDQLNEYLSAMTDVIFRWNGTLDKFVGDAIVVFWGAPADQPNHAELAVRCAIDMRRRLAELQVKWRTEGKPILENGIGINTGIAIVGNIGAEGKKMDYTMIGDSVNLAARMQDLTRRLRCPVLLTEYTAAKLAEGITGARTTVYAPLALRKLDMITVKGRQTPLWAYTIDDDRSPQQSALSA